MKIRCQSDIHIEFGMNFNMPVPDDDTILVLAGDICPWRKSKKYIKWLRSFSELYRNIIVIAGNHEFYGSDIARVIPSMKKNLEEKIPNLIFLDNETVEVDDVAFIGSTLWTDLQSNPVAAMAAYTTVNDFNTIKVRGKPFSLLDWNKFHTDAKLFLERALTKTRDLRQVVISHHLPTTASIPVRFRCDIINYAYASSLETMMYEHTPDVWIHGHTHDSFDYMLDMTRVICNPRGYEGHELNPNFNPEFEIEL